MPEANKRFSPGLLWVRGYKDRRCWGVVNILNHNSLKSSLKKVNTKTRPIQNIENRPIKLYDIKGLKLRPRFKEKRINTPFVQTAILKVLTVRHLEFEKKTAGHPLVQSAQDPCRATERSVQTTNEIRDLRVGWGVGGGGSKNGYSPTSFWLG